MVLTTFRVDYTLNVNMILINMWQIFSQHWYCTVVSLSICMWSDRCALFKITTGDINFYSWLYDYNVNCVITVVIMCQHILLFYDVYLRGVNVQHSNMSMVSLHLWLEASHDVAATNDEGKKSHSCTGPFLASIRNQSAFAKWKQAFIEDQKKSDERQVRKQHNMMNTTTSQPSDQWERFENTIKRQEQTNMSIRALCLWQTQKKRVPVVENVLCKNSLKTEKNCIFINVLWFYWITLVLYFLTNVLQFHCCVFFVTEIPFFIPSIIHYFPVCSLFLISTKSRTKQVGENSHLGQMTYHRYSRHERLTHWINKIIKLHKSPCHSTRVPTVFHLVCLAARGPLSCWEMRRLVSALATLVKPLCQPARLPRSTPLISWCKQKPSLWLWSLILLKPRY